MSVLCGTHAAGTLTSVWRRLNIVVCSRLWDTQHTAHPMPTTTADHTTSILASLATHGFAVLPLATLTTAPSHGDEPPELLLTALQAEAAALLEEAEAAAGCSATQAAQQRSVQCVWSGAVGVGTPCHPTATPPHRHTTRHTEAASSSRCACLSATRHARQPTISGSCARSGRASRACAHACCSHRRCCACCSLRWPRQPCCSTTVSVCVCAHSMHGRTPTLLLGVRLQLSGRQSHVLLLLLLPSPTLPPH